MHKHHKHLSDFRAPQCWKEMHILENFTFFMEKWLFLSMHASQIERMIQRFHMVLLHTNKTGSQTKGLKTNEMRY